MQRPEVLIEVPEDVDEDRDGEMVNYTIFRIWPFLAMKGQRSARLWQRNCSPLIAFWYQRTQSTSARPTAPGFSLGKGFTLWNPTVRREH